MNKEFEKIIEKLEKELKLADEEKLRCARENPLQFDSAKGYAHGVGKAIEIVKQEAEQYNNGWIPVEEELPKDGDNRYYMCIVENHEEDPPMYCQYNEECGFGFYQDIYDEHTLGFVDSEFQTNEELGYEKVIAWQQLLLYQPDGGGEAERNELK